MIVLGLDTSNYTTSVAAFDGSSGNNVSRLLDVKSGELGLRQSDALFVHVKRLPELTETLCASLQDRSVAAIGVSTRPREVEGSYMPCFLAGESQARVLGSILGVPVIPVSHQQGHIAAALWSAGRMDLIDRPFLAWHLSGGTTELLLVEPDGKNVRAQKIGGTNDISAGQVIDRTGKLLGLAFPAGKQIDALAQKATGKEAFRVKTKDLVFSLSGLENKMQEFYARTNSAEETAAFVLRSLISAVVRTTEDALAQYPCMPVVFSGGVASNSLLRDAAKRFDPVFAQPQYSTDNALGVAVLTWRLGDFDGTTHT
ncbi:MAG: DNA-binding protein [Oscillospiraceae bacterium]|nr:DNA-binding protein [Oscillospiraceae bacterium]